MFCKGNSHQNKKGLDQKADVVSTSNIDSWVMERVVMETGQHIVVLYNGLKINGGFRSLWLLQNPLHLQFS